MSSKWKEIIIKFALRKEIQAPTKLHKSHIIYKRSECDDLFSILNEYTMENILIYLKLNDLISVSKTSKKLLEHVKSFALHYVFSYSRMTILYE